MAQSASSGLTTTTTAPACTCEGGRPTKLSFTTGVGSGICGHVDADGNPNFFALSCGGLYFGGAGVGVSLPANVPDMETSFSKVSCNGTAVPQSSTDGYTFDPTTNCFTFHGTYQSVGGASCTIQYY